MKNSKKKPNEWLSSTEWITVNSWFLGGGTYGKVFRVRNVTNKEFRALKMCIPQPQQSNIILGCSFDTLREINALSLIRDPHVIRLIQADISYEPLLVETTTSTGTSTNPLSDEKKEATTTSFPSLLVNPYAYLLLEDGEESAAMWRNKVKLSKNDHVLGFELLKSCFHLLLGIRSLHTQKLMHNDIKPENLIRVFNPLTNQFELKLSDFGMSMYPESFKWKNSKMFAQGYRAPEILINYKARTANYSYPADIWAAAVTMSFLLFGSNPRHLLNTSEKNMRFACPFFPIGDDPTKIVLDIFTLLGNPTRSWSAQHINRQQPNDIQWIPPLKKESMSLSQEARMQIFVQRLFQVYGKEHLEILESMIGYKTLYDFIDLLVQCLQYETSSRPDIMTCLNHPCFFGVRQDPIEAKKFLTVVPCYPYTLTSTLTSTLTNSLTSSLSQLTLSDNSMITPCLKAASSSTKNVKNPAEIQIKLTRKFSFQKIVRVLSFYQKEKKYWPKEEAAAIIACSLNLFDRDLNKIFPILKDYQQSMTPLSDQQLSEIIAFAAACSWMAGKFLSIMRTEVCKSIADKFKNVSLESILHMEMRLINNANGFIFPRHFITSGFSISSDLSTVLDVALENDKNLCNNLFDTFFKTEASKIL